jgi:hypothetical protein
MVVRRANVPTTDAIYNLVFQTAYYICIDGDQPCQFGGSPSWYMALETVDLSKATVDVVSTGNLNAGDVGPYYSIRGDQSTYVGNASAVNGFDVQVPQNYSLSADAQCRALEQAVWPTFSWNGSTPFTYVLNFTNSSALGLFTISAPFGTVALSFAAERADGADLDLDPVVADNESHYTAVAIADPADHPAPHFEFANGSDFVLRGNAAFANGSEVNNGSSGSGNGTGSKSLAPAFKQQAGDWLTARLGLWSTSGLFAAAWLLFLL